MKISDLYKTLPESPGVYLMKDARGKILYIGKAANLRRRVSSYFTFTRHSLGEGGRPHDARIEKMVSRIARVDCKKTDSALEALILEAKFIKKYSPPFNVREKDDTSFLYIEITDEKLPRVLLARGKQRSTLRGGVFFGPFTQSSNLREAIRILRRIFPFNTHPLEFVSKLKRPCLDYELGLCPGTCIGAISEKDYKSSIKNLVRFLRGEKKAIVRDFEKQMKNAGKRLDFETAAKLKKQIFALRHIQDVALINDSELLKAKSYKLKAGYRIEGYDISNISGLFATGAMVVFIADQPDKDQYRKFKMNTVFGPDDTAMLKEVLSRRLQHREWPLPDLILVDGGKPQVSAAKGALDESGVSVPVIGIAKGPKRKKNEFVGRIPRWTDEKTLIEVRNEAHRFAIKYHRKLRGRFS